MKRTMTALVSVATLLAAEAFACGDMMMEMVDDSGAHPVPSERGRYAAFLEQVARSLQEGASSPVDVLEAREVVAVLEQAHALAAH